MKQFKSYLPLRSSTLFPSGGSIVRVNRSYASWPQLHPAPAQSYYANLLVQEPEENDISLNEYFKGIIAASNVIYEVCKETNLDYAPKLSHLLGNDVYLKREDQQTTHSFKPRGAFNKIFSLSEQEKRNGVVTCSAGNHAQGVALCAKKLGLKNVVVMPETTARIKVDSVRNLGGNVLLFGENFDSAQQKALEISASDGMTMIHPFDDFHVICGQGTIGMEVLKQMKTRSLDGLFTAVGGGGLIAGTGAFLKQLAPNIQIFGVGATNADAMRQSFDHNSRVKLETVNLFTDGTAIKKVGAKTFSVAKKVVDDVITVTDNDVCDSIKYIYNETRSIVEPSGALGVAGLINHIERTKITGKTFVCIVSGANMDLNRLRYILDQPDGKRLRAVA